MFGKGISKEGDILDLAVKENIIEKSGAWFAYGGGKIGQGRENAKKYLAEHEDICREVEVKVREKYGLTAAEGDGAPEAAKQETQAGNKRLNRPEAAGQEGKPEAAGGDSVSAREAGQ